MTCFQQRYRAVCSRRDEVKRQTLYEVLEVEETATTAEIRTASLVVKHKYMAAGNQDIQLCC
jgi:hypothetical protein